ncbi:MAG: site-specific integrase [Maribacter sp.]|nr:site-specific integrase [Maribacter sp.]
MGKVTRGVKARGNSIQISFTYKGQRIRHSIPIKPTPSNIKLIASKLEGIRYEIASNNFDYLHHFPNGAYKDKFIHSNAEKLTIKIGLERWLTKQNRKCQKSTLRDYSSAIHYHLIPAFGHFTISELKISDIEDWITSLLISNKRINNVLIPLRRLFDEKFKEGILSKNLFQIYKNLPISTRLPNPFSLEEIKQILGYLEDQNKNYFQFAFYSGLRTSELIALRWKNINFNNKTIFVCEAKVSGEIKATKTTTGTRTVRLQKLALEALKSQLQFTDEKEFVFEDPKTNCPWKDDQPLRKRVWIPALKHLNIVYREPYQTRHTFCSMLLSNGAPPFWVSKQMGHKDSSVTFNVYSKYIPINEDKIFL